MTGSRFRLSHRQFSLPDLPAGRPSIRNITGEALAGLLWMHLNLPKNVSLAELEGCAADLANTIRIAASNTAIEQKIRALQVEKRCLPLSQAAVAHLARQSIALVRSAGV